MLNEEEFRQKPAIFVWETSEEVTLQRPNMWVLRCRSGSVEPAKIAFGGYIWGRVDGAVRVAVESWSIGDFGSPILWACSSPTVRSMSDWSSPMVTSTADCWSSMMDMMAALAQEVVEARSERQFLNPSRIKPHKQVADGSFQGVVRQEGMFEDSKT